MNPQSQIESWRTFFKQPSAMSQVELEQAREQLNAMQQLWSGLGRNERQIIVVLPNIHNPDDPATGMGEATACPFLFSALQTALGPVLIEFSFSVEVEKALLNDREGTLDWLGKTDLILLGGKTVNKIADLAVQRLTPLEPWIGRSDCENSNQEVKDHWIEYCGGGKLRTKYSSESEPNPTTMAEDYGIFVVRPNCFSSSASTDTRVILIYGAHTYGTRAAADMLFNFRFAHHFVNRARSEGNPRWNYYLDGCTKVTPDLARTSTATPAPKHLTHWERRIELTAPASLAGFSLTNPVWSDWRRFQAALWDQAMLEPAEQKVPAIPDGGGAVTLSQQTERNPQMPRIEINSEQSNPILIQGSNQFAAELEELLVLHRGKWVGYHGLEKVGIMDSTQKLIACCKEHGFPLDECYFAFIEDEDDRPSVSTRIW